MKTWMSYAAMSAMVLMMSGCVPPDDTKLADLGSDDRERVCKRHNYPETTCDDGSEYDAFTEQECVDSLERLAGDGDCLATVGDLDDATSDPCSDEAARARTQLFTLSCIF